MADIFISYVEEDGGIVRELAKGIEAAGYSLWFYERDGVPGESYLLQTRKAIDECQAFILLISPKSVTSEQVTPEVVRAHETHKAFIPLRSGITHVEFAERQPEWSQALGAATSTLIPPEGPSVTIPLVLRGLTRLNIAPRLATGSGQLTTKPLREFERATEDPVAEASRETIYKVAAAIAQAPQVELRKMLYLIIAASLVAVALGAGLVYYLIPPPPPPKPLTFTPYSEDFLTLDNWNKPDGWMIKIERQSQTESHTLQIEGQPRLGYLKDKNYGDFVMYFQVKLLDYGGAAWALRVQDQDNYYLFYLSGAEAQYRNRLLAYVVRGGKRTQVGTSFINNVDLKRDRVYSITLKAEKNRFSYIITDDETGDCFPLGDVQDDNDVFKSGSVGFRAFENEKFAISRLTIQPRQADGKWLGLTARCP